MAVSIGVIGSIGSYSSSSSSSSPLRGAVKGRRGRMVICGTAAGGLTDQYQTLRIQPGASEKKVKKAFRQLDLQYHPDVCKGNNYGIQFHRINEAYDKERRRFGEELRERYRRQSQVQSFEPVQNPG